MEVYYSFSVLIVLASFFAYLNSLSVDEGPYKAGLIAITYFVVVFSIIIQGLSIGKLETKVLSKEALN